MKWLYSKSQGNFTDFKVFQSPQRNRISHFGFKNSETNESEEKTSETKKLKSSRNRLFLNKNIFLKLKKERKAFFSNLFGVKRYNF